MLQMKLDFDLDFCSQFHCTWLFSKALAIFNRTPGLSCSSTPDDRFKTPAVNVHVAFDISVLLTTVNTFGGLTSGWTYRIFRPAVDRKARWHLVSHLCCCCRAKHAPLELSGWLMTSKVFSAFLTTVFLFLGSWNHETCTQLDPPAAPEKTSGLGFQICRQHSL